MVKATGNGAVLAESDNTIVVEGNHYFSPDSLHYRFSQGSNPQTSCPWKGVVHCYDIKVNGQINNGAA